MADHDHVDDVAQLERLLDLAGAAASWGDQMYRHFADKPGGAHFQPKMRSYLNARVDYFAPRRPLMHRDYGGCVCLTGSGAVGMPLTGARPGDDPGCPYHRAAAAQPWNHHIPANCPTYWDGCNCPAGPHYQRPHDGD